MSRTYDPIAEVEKAMAEQERRWDYTLHHAHCKACSYCKIIHCGCGRVHAVCTYDEPEVIDPYGHPYLYGCEEYDGLEPEEA